MRLLGLLSIALISSAGASAQNDPPGRVGRLNYISGTVSFQPGGVDEWVAANLNRPLTTGDHLWVDQNGRAELHIGSAALRLNSGTAFEFLNLSDESVQIRLAAGSAEIRLRSLDENQTFEVDTPNLAYSLLRPGTYRIDVNPDTQTTTVTARTGQGEVTGGGQAFQVQAREQARVSGDQTITYDMGSAPPPDWFDNFCDLRDRREEQSESARFVSRDMTGYEDLDNAGDWRPEPEYGNVWFPRAVPVGWAPYRYGHWAWIEPWGWTWVDNAAWGFAPFHYGRWALVGGGWGWIPGPVAVRPVYAPALVAFIGGPRFNLSVSIGGGGGVAWFPLGPREVYVPAYHASPTYVTRVNTTNTVINNINVTNVTNVTNVRYINQTAPGAVTAVSRETFVGARPVGQARVEVRAQELAGAQVVRSAGIAPDRVSVLGRGVASASIARPPAAVMARPVVARAQAPAPVIPFAARQQALEQNAGRPLDPSQLRSIRSSQPAPVHPYVRQADVAPGQRQAPIFQPNEGGGRPRDGGAPGRFDRAPAPVERVPQVENAPQPPRNAERPVRPNDGGGRPRDGGAPGRFDRAPAPVERVPQVENAPQPPRNAERPVRPNDGGGRPRDGGAPGRFDRAPAAVERVPQVENAPQPPRNAERPVRPNDGGGRPRDGGAPGRFDRAPAAVERVPQVENAPQPPRNAERPVRPEREVSRPAPTPPRVENRREAPKERPAANKEEKKPAKPDERRP